MPNAICLNRITGRIRRGPSSAPAMKFAESHVSLAQADRLMKASPERFGPIFDGRLRILASPD